MAKEMLFVEIRELGRNRGDFNFGGRWCMFRDEFYFEYSEGDVGLAMRMWERESP